MKVEVDAEEEEEEDTAAAGQVAVRDTLSDGEIMPVQDSVSK